jgi:hypothetical protein
VVKSFRDDAKSQGLLLGAFQQQNWQQRIENPFRGEEGYPDPKAALHRTIQRLNRVTRHAGLRFRGAGTGDVRWEEDA